MMPQEFGISISSWFSSEANNWDSHMSKNECEWLTQWNWHGYFKANQDSMATYALLDLYEEGNR